jgi:hypothetical protein
MRFSIHDLVGAQNKIKLKNVFKEWHVQIKESEHVKPGSTRRADQLQQLQLDVLRQLVLAPRRELHA